MVESAVYLGTATQMVVRLAGDVPLTVLVPTRTRPSASGCPGAGARVRLAWSPEHMHLVAASGAPAQATTFATRNTGRIRFRPRHEQMREESK